MPEEYLLPLTEAERSARLYELAHLRLSVLEMFAEFEGNIHELTDNKEAYLTGIASYQKVIDKIDEKINIIKSLLIVD